jgi:hypothetical protein
MLFKDKSLMFPPISLFESSSNEEPSIDEYSKTVGAN